MPTKSGFRLSKIDKSIRFQSNWFGLFRRLSTAIMYVSTSRTTSTSVSWAKIHDINEQTRRNFLCKETNFIRKKWHEMFLNFGPVSSFRCEQVRWHHEHGVNEQTSHDFLFKVTNFMRKKWHKMFLNFDSVLSFRCKQVRRHHGRCLLLFREKNPWHKQTNKT